MEDSGTGGQQTVPVKSVFGGFEFSFMLVHRVGRRNTRWLRGGLQSSFNGCVKGGHAGMGRGRPLGRRVRDGVRERRGLGVGRVTVA